LIRNGLLDELKKALAERALNAEMDHHLGNGDGSSRSGYGKKTTQIVLDVREIGSLERNPFRLCRGLGVRRDDSRRP
jgi:hypothetical protein